MYMCMYIHIDTGMCRCLLVRMCIHVCNCMGVCIRIYINVSVHTCVYVCMYICTYVCMYGCMHACLDVSIHACLHAFMYEVKQYCNISIYRIWENVRREKLLWFLYFFTQSHLFPQIMALLINNISLQKCYGEGFTANRYFPLKV